MYAVARNIEDISLAQMTPMIREQRDSERRFTMRDRSTEYQVLSLIPNHVLGRNILWIMLMWDVCVAQEEPLEIDQPKWKYCADLSSYGAEVCMNAEAKRVQNLKDYPLNYILGYTQFSCQLEPGILYYKLDFFIYAYM